MHACVCAYLCVYVCAFIPPCSIGERQESNFHGFPYCVEGIIEDIHFTDEETEAERG